jgi:hypothetical protein
VCECEKRNGPFVTIQQDSMMDFWVVSFGFIPAKYYCFYRTGTVMQRGRDYWYSTGTTLHSIFHFIDATRRYEIKKLNEYGEW